MLILLTTPALPDVGVDVATYITLAIVGLGTVALVATGGYVVFLLTRRATEWALEAMDARAIRKADERDYWDEIDREQGVR